MKQLLTIFSFVFCTLAYSTNDYFYLDLNKFNQSILRKNNRDLFRRPASFLISEEKRRQSAENSELKLASQFLLESIELNNDSKIAEINGSTFYEGEFLSENTYIAEIGGNFVLLSSNGKRIELFLDNQKKENLKIWTSTNEEENEGYNEEPQ